MKIVKQSTANATENCCSRFPFRFRTIHIAFSCRSSVFFCAEGDCLLWNFGTEYSNVNACTNSRHCFTKQKTCSFNCLSLAMSVCQMILCHKLWLTIEQIALRRAARYSCWGRRCIPFHMQRFRRFVSVFVLHSVDSTILIGNVKSFPDLNPILQTHSHRTPSTIQFRWRTVISSVGFVVFPFFCFGSKPKSISSFDVYSSDFYYRNSFTKPWWTAIDVKSKKGHSKRHCRAVCNERLSSFFR